MAEIKNEQQPHSFKRKLGNNTYTVKVHFNKNTDKTFKDIHFNQCRFLLCLSVQWRKMQIHISTHPSALMSTLKSNTKKQGSQDTQNVPKTLILCG